MSSDVVDGETIKKLSFSDLMDLIYHKARDNNALYLTVQYATKVEEICSFHFDIISDQDLYDAVVFMKGFDTSDGYGYLHSVKFTQYQEIPFKGSAKRWLGGEKWPVDSQDPAAES